MQIEPATCPACGGAYDPLRAQAVTVIDGRVRAFCSATCRARGIAPPAAPTRTTTDAHPVVAAPPPSLWRRVPTEQKILIAATMAALAAFVVMISLGRHRKPTGSSTALDARATSPLAAAKATPGGDGAASEVWIQPLAGAARHVVKRDRRLFFGREGLPASECAGGRCTIEIDAVAGAVVMAVHDGVIETVERDPLRGEEGRFVRINHNGGAIASSYLQLDGIRQDLKAGVPVKAGEPIGTVAHSGSTSTRPHLRFSMSVRSAADGSVLFIDPQPLLALWPIRRDAPVSLRAMERAPSPSEDEEGSAARPAARRAAATE